MSDSEETATRKRRFWRRVLMAGILVVVFSLLMMVTLYLGGIADAKAKSDAITEMELEIAALSARNPVLLKSVQWTIPLAFLGSLMANIARYRLRKLKNL